MDAAFSGCQRSLSALMWATARIQAGEPPNWSGSAPDLVEVSGDQGDVGAILRASEVAKASTGADLDKLLTKTGSRSCSGISFAEPRIDEGAPEMIDDRATS
jgi:hypothetical protein